MQEELQFNRHLPQDTSSQCYDKYVNADIPVRNTPAAFTSALLSFVLQEWKTLADIIPKLLTWLRRDRVGAAFEVLDYDSTVDLRDPRGHKAVFYRVARVRFLQDHTIAFQDHVWGDGDTLAKYRISPGRVADRYRDGDRWNLLISLRQTMSRGDVEEFHTERTARNSFTQPEEWIQTETWLPTHHLRIAVTFPKARPCRAARVHTRSQNQETVLDDSHFHTLPNGRTQVVWEKSHPKRGEIFTLKWTW